MHKKKFWNFLVIIFMNKRIIKIKKNVKVDRT